MNACRIKTSLIAGNPLELSAPQSSHETGKLEGLKSTEIGQSAAKLRTGERSSTIPEGSRSYIDVGPKREDLGYIYLLMDRFSGEVRYVGSTIRAPLIRIAEHFRARHDSANEALTKWLSTSDYPVVKVLSYPKRLVYKAEKYWIKYYSSDNRLFNYSHNTDATYGFRKISKHTNVSKSRPCCKVDCETGEAISCYKSMTYASMQNNVHISNIMHVISGSRNRAGGYCWILNKI